MKKIPFVILLFILLFTFADSTLAQTNYSYVYLPIIYKSRDHELTYGLYSSLWLGTQDNVNKELNALSNFTGKKVSLAGTFTDICEPNYDAAIKMQFEKMYENGYTPFINLMINSKIQDMNMNCLRLWARNFREVLQKDERVAFIAPLPEMNGNWTRYYSSPEVFKNTFYKIQQTFREENVPINKVLWVFAPNGWSQPQDSFEYYYPGDEFVDVVGFSAYNYGFCKYPGHKGQWLSLEKITDEYIKRMKVMAPSKPIFITQIATSSKTSWGYQQAEKDEWFREGVKYLIDAKVNGLVYYNRDDQIFDNSSLVDICDLALYRSWQSQFPVTYEGFKDSVNTNQVIYSPTYEYRKYKSSKN